MFEKMFGSAISRGFKTIFSPDRGTINFMLGYFPLFIFLELSISYLNVDLLRVLTLDSDNIFKITMTSLSFFFVGIFLVCSILPPYIYISKKINSVEGLRNNYYSYFLKKEFYVLFGIFIISTIFFGVLIGAFLPPKVLSDFYDIQPYWTALYVAVIASIGIFILIRLCLLTPHISLGNPIEIKKIFKASQGHFWVLVVSFIVVSIPALLFSLGLNYVLSGAFVSIPQNVSALTASLEDSPLGLNDVLGACGRFIVQYLGLATIASLAELYKHILSKGGEPD